MISGDESKQSASAAVLWHDVENGAYVGDLDLWRELASAASVNGPVLDLGCGTGRVTLDLARRGHEAHGVDLDGELVTALNARAAAAGLPARATRADARDMVLERRFGLVIAPMQMIQLLDTPAERVACLRRAGAHLLPGGSVAVALVHGFPEELVEEGPPPLPDTREIDGWVYSSLPLDAALDAGTIYVRRLRHRVSPTGELDEQLDEIPLRLLRAEQVEEEAREAGLRPAGRREIEPTDSHIGSVVVILEAD